MIGTPTKKIAPSPASRSRRGRVTGTAPSRRAAPAASRRRGARERRFSRRTPARNAGLICSLMMRPAVTSGIAPCSVAATWMLTSRSFLATVSSRPSPTSFRPSFQFEATRCRERGDVFGSRRRHDQDHDLRAALLFDRRELAAERLALRRSQRRRLVDHPAGEDRHGNDVFGECGAEGEPGEHGRRGEDCAHRAPSLSATRPCRSSPSAAPRSALRWRRRSWACPCSRRSSP